MKRSVLHVHWTFPPTTGGVESHLSDLARLQAAAGWRVTVLTGEPAPLRQGGYEVISTPLLDLETARRAAGCESAVTALSDVVAQIVRAREVGVIHGHNLHHFSVAPALALEALRVRLGVKIQHTFHETWPDVLAETPVYRRWDGNHAVSHFVSQQCGLRLGFEPKVLQLGVDVERFAPTREAFADDDLVTILHPARMLPWKGVHISILALRSLRDEGRRVRLVLTDTQRIADWDGSLPSYRRSLLALVEELGLMDSVTLAPASFADMPALYNAADVVLYPTIRDEPFGLVPLEAMACARPVVASRSGGIPESIEDGVTGRLVEPDAPGELAEGICGLLDDPIQARRMGRCGRARVEAHFSAARYVARLEQLYLA